MADQLPDPLVPAEVDLRDFAYMPLDVVRLMRSSAWRKIRRAPELGYWSVNLWASSWHEVPAASLPDDDDELADFARCEPKTWDKVKAKVLAGWVKCSDGRLYHPVVAEKALEAWAKMNGQRKRTHAAREALKRKLLETATKDVAAILTAPAATSVTETATASKGTEGTGTEGNRTDSEEAASSVPREEPLVETESTAAGDQQSAHPEAQAVEPHAKLVDQPEDDLAMPPALARRQLEDRAYALWSALAQELGLPDAGFLNSALRPALGLRLTECGGLDGWNLALTKLREAKYLRNDDDTPKWWVNLKWFVDPGNFTGLMEGRYAEQHRRSSDSNTTSALAALAEFGRTGTG